VGNRIKQESILNWELGKQGMGEREMGKGKGGKVKFIPLPFTL